MGRIKTDMVKRTTVQLMEAYPEKFTTDFGKNKKVLNETVQIRSKKLRNVIAGYSVRLKQAKEQLAPKARKKEE